MKSHLECIQQWYRDHYSDIFLDTLDNPGWSLIVNLKQKDLEEKPFKEIKINRGEDDWIMCWVVGNKFNGVGGGLNLEEILYFFRQWAISDIKAKPSLISHERNIQWLQKWYHINCNGDWEHTYGVLIKTLENKAWSLLIDLNETELEQKQFRDIEIQRSSEDWIKCWVSDNKFEGRGGCLNLSEILSYFRQWSKSHYE